MTNGIPNKRKRASIHKGEGSDDRTQPPRGTLSSLERKAASVAFDLIFQVLSIQGAFSPYEYYIVCLTLYMIQGCGAGSRCV